MDAPAVRPAAYIVNVFFRERKIRAA
jgi:hypothetical protein